MSPYQPYFSLVTATLFVLSSSGMALPVTMVTSNALTKSLTSEFAQVESRNNKNFEVKRLNEDAIKLLDASRFAEALQRLQTALTISTGNGDRFQEAATLNNIGRVYQKQGQNSQAFKFYVQALAINKDLTNSETNPGLARIAFGKTYSNLGNLFESQNQPELAIFFYKQCVNHREQARLNPSAFAIPLVNAYSQTVAQTYRALGENLLKGGRVAEAQRIMDLVKVEELEEYINSVKGNKRTAKGIELIPQEKKLLVNLSNKVDSAIALGKQLTALRQIEPSERSPEQKQRLAQLVTTQQKILDDFQNFITSPSVREQVEQINRTARRQNLDLESLNEVRDNLAQLPQKSVLFYPLVLKDSLELVLVTPESPPIHRTVAVKRENLNKTILAFRKALQDPRLDAKIPARQLYDWLIRPLENDLKQADAKTLIYAPDNQLRYIPLAALYNGKWLVQSFAINHITSASLTNFNTPPESKLRVLAAAFTKGDYTVTVGTRQFAFSGLPFALQEVESLAQQVPGTTKLLDAAFSRQATLPQLDDYTVIHLATHAAFVVGKPEDSFILFGNGERATLRDVATWSLPRVDLVVLSACETGLGGKLGNGEEILGFGYQIQKTGAKSAIASLWAVDDGGTQALMSAFYAALYKGKFTKAEALRQAQIALITGDLSAIGLGQERSPNTSTGIGVNLSDPYYWAPFILIGNGL
jgi:CHAT domain-containing protein